MKANENSKRYVLVVVGIVSALGPFVTDFYLPALPLLSDYFSTTASLVQFSLTFSMIGLAVGQLVIGPLSDKYGRKLPLLFSLVLFCLATLGCLYAETIYWFLFFRLIQGGAGSGGVVLSRSIATDLYHGRELTRFFFSAEFRTRIGPDLCTGTRGRVVGGDGLERNFLGAAGHRRASGCCIIVF